MTITELKTAQTEFLQACEDALTAFKVSCPEATLNHVQHNYPMAPVDGTDFVNEQKFGCSVTATIDGAEVTRSI